MKTLFVALLFLGGFNSGDAYTNFISEAKKAFNSGDYKTSAQQYDKAFATGTYAAEDLFNAACAWTMSGSPEKGMHYLHQAAANGYANLETVKTSSFIDALRSNPQYRDAVLEIKKNERKAARAAKKN